MTIKTTVLLLASLFGINFVNSLDEVQPKQTQQTQQTTQQVVPDSVPKPIPMSEFVETPCECPQCTESRRVELFAPLRFEFLLEERQWQIWSTDPLYKEITKISEEAKQLK